MRTFVIAALLLVGCDKPKPEIGGKHWAPAHAGIARLAKAVSAVHEATGAFPVGTAAVLPVSSAPGDEMCCWGPDRKCPVSNAWASDPVWSALKFEIREPTDFRYTYESDGQTVTASAIGDWDCDTNTVALVLKMSFADGKVTSTTIEPNVRKD